MHVINMNSFNGKYPIEKVLEKAAAMIPQARMNRGNAQFTSHKVVLLFLERSTRTMFSTEQAAKNLGMRTTIVSGSDHTSVMKGESFADTLRMFIGQGARVIALRTKIEGAPLFATRVSQEYISKKSVINPGPVNIINCGDGRQWHPTQTVLDGLTIQEMLGRLNNFTLGIMGDPGTGRTSHTLLQLFGNRNIKLRIAAPKGFGMPSRYIVGFDDVEESDSLDILSECHIVYDTRFQLERMSDEERRFIEQVRHKFIIDKKVLDSWQPDIRIMHPLPRVEEIAAEVSMDPRIIAFEQAEYGIAARMAIISLLCSEPFIPYELPAEPDKLISNIDDKKIDSQKPVKYFQPIEKGTVVDHIPAGNIHLIIQVLRDLGVLEDNQPRIYVENVKSGRYESGRKDLLLINNTELPQMAGAVLQTMFPNTTINFLPGNGTMKKVSFNTPVKVPVQATCSNEWCITNHDKEAHPSFIFEKPAGTNQLAVCEYCGTPLWK